MTRKTSLVLAAITLVFLAVCADAYHLFYVNNAGTLVPVKWQTMGNVFIADMDGPTGQNFTTLCTTATSTWNAVTDAQDVFGTPTTSAVNFTGANLHTAWGNLTGDGRYELAYDADGSALTALGYDPAVINGYGPSRRRLVGANGIIDDAFFVVTGTRTDFDLLSTLIHELGHIQGLAHSTVGMHTSSTAETALDKVALNSVPTMHPFSLGLGNTNRRTLEPDDMAALRELYPESGAAARWASITGEVKRCGSNAGVIGANVRLISTANTNLQISRFSSYDGNADGRYVMNYVPAGSYRIVVEPMGANDFVLNRFGSPPSKTEDDFDFEYLSPSAIELGCTEEIPESGTSIATVNAAVGTTRASNDFRVGAPDLAFVVDDTGSMLEEIGGVRNILNAAITALQLVSPIRPFPLTAIVTFKDDVTKRIVSNDPAKLKTVVNGLVADAGGDCPESSNAALLVAGRMLRKNGVAMLFTDADSRSDGPARSTVESQYRAKGVRLFTLLSGTCTGSITPSGSSGLMPMNSGTQPDSSNQDGGSVARDEYPNPPTNGSEPGVTTFSNISTATGGFFVAITGISTGDATETTRYVNTGTNLSVSAAMPAVALVTPTNTPRGSILNIELNGSNTNFIAGQSTLSIAGGDVTVNTVNVTSATRLTAKITVAAGATLGFRDAVVTTNLGAGTTEQAKGVGVINVTASPTTPTTISATPALGGQGRTLDVTINAAAVTFTSASVASFGTGVTVVSTTLIDANTLLARIQVALGATVGYRRVSVTTPGAGTAVDNSPSGVFQVVASAPVVPVIVSVTPNQVVRGASATLSVTGLNTNFGPTTTVAFSGSGITTNSLTVNSTTELTVSVAVAADAPLGFRDVTANTAGQTAAILNGLQILAPPNPAPTITTLSPSSAVAGGAAFTLTVNGTNFIPSSEVRWNGLARTTTFVSATQLTASIAAGDIATEGTGQVTIFNPTPGGGLSNSANFTISNPPPPPPGGGGGGGGGGGSGPDFALRISPASQSVVQGSTANYSAVITAPASFIYVVSLACSDLPAGATCTFDSNPARPGTVPFRVSTTGSTPPGPVTFTVTAEGGARKHSATADLEVLEPPDFTITVAPSSQSVTPGNAASYTVTVSAASGSTGIVTLACTGLPAGATCAFSPASTTSGTAKLTVSTSTDTPLGTFKFTVSGTSGPLVRSATVELSVGGLSLTVSPAEATQGSTVNIQVVAANAGSTAINSLWLALDIAAGDGRTMDSTKLPLNPAGRIDLGAAQGQNLAPGESRTFSASFTFDSSRYSAGTYKYLFQAWQGGSPGGEGTPITSLQEQLLTITPSLCVGPEPELSVMLTPGFYVAAVQIPPQGTEGYWEMGVEPRQDQRAGGFIFGGAVQGKGATPFFAAFSIPFLEPVSIQLNPRLLPGGDPGQFSACARLLNSQRQQIGSERCSTGYIEFRQTLPPDFYIVEVRTGAASPGAYFEMGLSDSQFAPSLIAGGFAAQGVGNFVAFSIGQPQEVHIKAAGQGTFGGFGAGCLQLTLFDAARNVIRTVP